MRISRRQVLREAGKLNDENMNLKKERGNLFNMLFGIAVKLYQVKPDDEIFVGDTFKPEFLAKIKEAAAAQKDIKAPV